MDSKKKLKETDIENISAQKIADDVYHFLVLDWKSSSLVSYRKSGEPKKLKRCVEDIVNLSYEKSQYWFSKMVPDLAEKVIEQKKDEALNSLPSKKSLDICQNLDEIKSAFYTIYDKEKENKQSSGMHFANLILQGVQKKYENTEQLRPNYWEQFMKDYHNGKGINYYHQSYEEERKNVFDGVFFDEIDETKFYNNIALPFVAQKNQQHSRIKILTDEIINYTTKVNEFKNTHLLTKKLVDLQNQPVNQLNLEKFDSICNYKPIDLDIEKRHKDAIEKNQLNGVLNKIKNKS